jgi:hypothetical protein
MSDYHDHGLGEELTGGLQNAQLETVGWTELRQ